MTEDVESNELVNEGTDSPKTVMAKNPQEILKRELRKLGIYCLSAYLIVAAVIAFTPLYGLVILRPQGKTDLYNATINNKEEIKFQNTNGDTLHAWLIRRPGSKQIALVHHGNAGNIINRLLIARDFSELGISTFLYDYRGYGMSTGKTDLMGMIYDGQAAYDCLTKTLGYKPEDIIVYGESIGTAVACRVAQDRPSKAIVLQSGLTSLPDVAYDGVCWLRIFPNWIFPNPHFCSAEIIGNLDEPILFIHGLKDRTIPSHHSEALYALAKNSQKEIVFLPDAGHNDVQDTDEAQFKAALSGFLKKLAPTEPALSSQ